MEGLSYQMKVAWLKVSKQSKIYWLLIHIFLYVLILQKLIIFLSDYI